VSMTRRAIVLADIAIACHVIGRQKQLKTQGLTKCVNDVASMLWRALPQCDRRRGAIAQRGAGGELPRVEKHPRHGARRLEGPHDVPRLTRQQRSAA